MASTFAGRISLNILATEILSDGIKAGQIPYTFDPESGELSLPNGTSAGTINKAYAARVTGIGASVTTVYDLIGTLTDTSAATINFDKACLIAIHNRSTTAANYLTVGPDATNGFGVVSSNQGFYADASDRNAIGADGWMVLFNPTGVPAAAGSTDELAIITQGGTSANTWDVLILGIDSP